MSARRWLLLLLLHALLLPATAGAQPPVQRIHKCRVDGVASYQSLPCAQHRTEQVWEVDVLPPGHRHAARIEAIRRELKARERERVRAANHPPHRSGHRPHRRTNRSRAPPGAIISWHAQPARCDAARRQRQAAYRKAGLQRSFALSRRMDDRVHAACR